jgi:hypothetical protein
LHWSRWSLLLFDSVWGSLRPIRKSWEAHGAPQRSEETIEIIRHRMYDGDEDPESQELLERARTHALPEDRRVVDSLLGKLKQLDSDTSEDQP